MKKIYVIMLCALVGCSTIKDYVKKTKVDLPPIGGTTTTTTIPPTQQGCNCDLSQPYQTPPWTAKELADAGNAEECSVYAGHDARLLVKRIGGTPWAICSLSKYTLSYNGNMVTSKCFDCPRGGRMHFIGYSTKYDNPDFVEWKSGVPYKQPADTFFPWYEWRPK